MNIEKIVNTLFSSNTYILFNNNGAIVIDPGSDFDKIDNYIKSNHLNVLAVLLTHVHFDHCYSAHKFEKFGVPIFVASAERNKILRDGDMSKFVANSFIPCKSTIVFNKSVLNLGDFSIRVLQTPGHTFGSLSFLIDDILFTGDLVFKDGVGRCDLYDSSEKSLVSSIKIICQLDNGVKVYPGHGVNTTIKEIKKYLNIE